MANPKRQFLLTGAQGFLGAWIAKSLVEQGERPLVFDLSRDPKRMANLLSEKQLGEVEFIQGDITDLDEVRSVVADRSVTHIIHLAALQVPFCAADPLLGARVNVLGTLNVFEAARQNAEVTRSIVYASSAAVFGPEEYYGGKRVEEGAPLLPGTHYGVYKQCNEGNARVYYQTEGLSSVGLRPWALYGVGRDRGITSGPTKAIKAAVARKPYTIKFTGGLDLQYAEDCAEIFLRCAEASSPGAPVYTLRGSVTHMDKFVEQLESAYPPARGLIRIEGPRLPMAHDLDDSALVGDLKQVPRTPLAEGIARTVEIFERLQKEDRLDLTDLEE